MLAIAVLVIGLGLIYWGIEKFKKSATKGSMK